MGSRKPIDVNEPLLCPFTILIDSAEQQPFEFVGFRADADQHYRPLSVPTAWKCLGRHPLSKGDYSIDGYVGQIGIERKSMADAHNTILGWDGHRDRFISELENLSKMRVGAVIVECDYRTLILNAPVYGKRTKEQNAKSLHRSLIAWRHDFPSVQWLFCGDREFAQIDCFRTMQKFWVEQQKVEKSAAEAAAAFVAIDQLPISLF